MRNIFYPCRVYVYTMNPFGKDSWKFNGKAENEQGLFKILSRIRDEFHDSYKELDRYVYMTDNNEMQFDVRPSTILKKLGGESEVLKKKQIRLCKHCFYHVDEKMNYCPDFGKIGCERHITVTDYWNSQEGKERLRKANEKDKEYWESQPPEEREFHELDEKYTELFYQWGDTSISKEKEKELNSRMDDLVRRLKELKPEFVDYRDLSRCDSIDFEK